MSGKCLLTRGKGNGMGWRSQTGHNGPGQYLSGWLSNRPTRGSKTAKNAFFLWDEGRNSAAHRNLQEFVSGNQEC